MNKRPTSKEWKVRRDVPLAETVREATERVVKFYAETLRKLGKA